jgi:cholesterol transport system auxiliary component
MRGNALAGKSKRGGRFAFALLAAMSASLTGCGLELPGQGPPPRLFELSPKNTFDAELPTVDWQLVIEVPAAAASVDTTRISLRRSAREHEYYARASWTDRSTVLIQTLLVESFENSGRIVAVGRESLGLRADFVLKSELREFQALYLDADLASPPEAHVRLALKLVKMPERAIIGAESFESKVRAREDSLEAVVDAFDEALGKVLKQVVGWTLVTGETVERESLQRRR